MKYTSLLILTAALLLSGPAALAKKLALTTRYRYTDLMTKNYNEMNDFVQAQITKVKNILDNESPETTVDERETQAVQILKQTLRLIFSRPDKDAMIRKILPDVRRKLQNLHSYADTLESLSSECIYNIKENKMAPVHIATCVFVLENIMAEVKPEVKTNKTYVKILEKVAKEDIEVPRKVRSYRRMRGMFKTSSLSETASKILEKNHLLKED